MESPVRVFSAKEKAAYEIHKATVITHRERAKEWGTALLTIKTTESYLIEFPTWQEWVSHYVPWSLRTLEAIFAEESASLAQNAGEPVIRKKRKYAKKDKPNSQSRNGVMDKASEDKPTSSHPAKEPKVEDEMGTIIPKPILDIWNRRGELEDLAKQLSSMKCLIAERRKEEDPLFMKIDQSSVNRLEQLYNAIVKATPYCVCGECEGRLELRDGTCGACHSTGFMSKQEYELLVPDEKRKIRIKGIELRKAK